jgi:hypothetical protein
MSTINLAATNAADLKLLQNLLRFRNRSFKSKGGTGNFSISSAPAFPKFV